MRAIYPTQKDIKNENAIDAVLEAIMWGPSIYDIEHDAVDFGALDDIYYQHIDATVIANARNVTSEQSIDHLDNLTEIFGYHGAIQINTAILDVLAAERGMLIEQKHQLIKKGGN